ncbi:alginate lyase family protein [Bacillus niameyensis]|uniref:alginate lyase family protein n=1 Tax=Bacillus niameyensis TaxID=1522308 RepID=UPI000783AC77|nr:alginate lyase family protein [Bacillus niameyensis]
MTNLLKLNQDILNEFGVINLDNILRLTDANSNTEKNAQLILDNHFVLQESLDILDFSNGIDWDYKHYVSSNTYQLYLHSLMPISYLGNAFEATNDTIYLKKAIKIVKDWLEFDSNDKDNKFIWYDHTSAYRTHNLIYLFLCLKRINLPFPDLDELIIKHAEFLYKDTYYRKNNHGIMMDRALIQAGVVFNYPNADNWKNKGLFRLKDNFYSSYSSKGVHLENSPEYHLVVERLFHSIEDFLNKYDLTLGKEIIGKFKLIAEYYSFILKPDGYLPMIGDSSHKKLNRKEKKYTSFFDLEAGISILQAKNNQSPINSTWLSFVCGYSTLTHKHFDDLSINLFYNGHDIFVDSGKHSYGSSPERGYVRSARAHNTIVINNKNYVHPDPEVVKDRISITAFSSNRTYDYVKGINLGYEGTSIERAICFIKPNVLIILDKVSSKTVQKCSQFFTLSPKVKIVKEGINHTVLKSQNDEVHIEQLIAPDKLTIHKGNTEKPNAVVSETFSKLSKTHKLEYMAKNNKVHFLTLIRLGKETTRVTDIHFELENSQLSLNIDGNYFSFVM